MVIGRTDEQQNPLIPMALTCRAVVWMSLAEPIWASGHATALTGRTHDRIRTKTKSRKNHLNPTGRPHMVLEGDSDIKLNRERFILMSSHSNRSHCPAA